MIRRIRSTIARWRQDTFLQMLLIILGGALLVYLPSLGNQFVDFDDVLLVRENSIIHQFNAHSIYQAFTSYDPELYIPLTFVSYMMEYAVVGNHPFLYHLDSLLLHIVNIVLVAFFIVLLTRKKRLSLMVAALFALHPLQVEAVAWVAARKDVLSAAFFFASLGTYLLYRRRDRKWDPYYWASLVLFILALLSKVSVVLLPVVLLLIDWFQGRKTSLRRKMYELGPFLMVAIVFIIIAIHGKQEIWPSENPMTLAIVGLRSLVFSASGILYPFHFSPLYILPYPLVLWTPQNILMALLSISISVVSLLPIVRAKAKECTFGWWFFVFCMVPSMTNVSKAGDMYLTSDRYAYAGSVGLFLICALGFLRLVHYWHVKEKFVRISIVILLVFFGTLTVLQAQVWHSVLSLSRNMVARSPDSSLAHRMLGNALLGLSDKTMAMAEYQKALDLRPDLAKNYTPIAMLNQLQGNEKKAQELLTQALKIDPTDAENLSQMGLMEYNRGNDAKAIEYYKQSLRYGSQRVDLSKRVATYNNLAAAYAHAKMYDKELEQYARAVAIDPFFYYGYYNMGLNYLERGKQDDALQAFKKSIEINPAFVQGHMRIAVIYAQNNAWSDALDEAKIVKQLEPNYDHIDMLIDQINAKISVTTTNPLHDVHNDGLGMPLH